MRRNLIFLIFSSLFSISLCDVPSDIINNLPGINFAINFKQYSGFLQPDNDTFMHYWLVESQNDPATDPLVLWLNGGPGCSSLMGLFQENGPYRITNINTTVSENVYGWNKVANVLYLESPQVVGFSYTTDRRHTKFGDNETALLNYNTLKVFFSKYPEYSNRNFYITGESYAGVYLPTLSMYLIQDPDIAPRFKGMAIGNGLLTDNMDKALVPMIYDHVLVGERIWNKMVTECCNGNAMACDYDAILDGSDSNCTRMVGLIASLPDVSGLDPYNLYDTCYIDPSIQNRARTVFYQTVLKKRGLTMEKVRSYAKQFGVPVVNRKANTQQYPDCYYDGITMYLQRQDVRQAINIPDSVHKWEECAGIDYSGEYNDMAQQLQATIAAKVPILIYNGDCDTVCNALTDKQFVASLGRELINDTVPWNYQDDTINIGGWQTLYDGISFLSVRGSGHYVPQDRPREALQMIANFIWNKPFSTPTGINVTAQPLLDSFKK